MFGIEAGRLLSAMIFLVGWLGVAGSAWACDWADESERGRAISAGVFEVIGSSATHLALREYTNIDCDDSEQKCPVACNYAGVAALAKKFEALTGQDLGNAGTGITLHFVRYKPGAPVHLVRKAFEQSFPIYETVRAGRACTSEPAALGNLQKAKAFAKTVGIDLKRAVQAERLKTPKLGAEACFPGSGSKDCFFRHEFDSGGPEFACSVYSLNNPAVCHGGGAEDGCVMPSSTAMQVWLGFGTQAPAALASEQIATAVQITQDRRVDNTGMSLEPLVAFSNEGRQVLGFIFKFTYGCGAPLPSMHLVVLP
jgi:hypothetical protein